MFEKLQWTLIGFVVGFLLATPIQVGPDEIVPVFLAWF